MNDEILKNEKSDKKIAYIKGSIIGVLAIVIAMLLFSAIILFFNLDRAYSLPFATISAALGVFFASHYTAKKIGDRGYLIGFIISVAVFVIITVISMIINNAGFNINTLFHFIIIVLSGVVGGIMGVNHEKKQKLI